jgi:hypothetical protein
MENNKNNSPSLAKIFRETIKSQNSDIASIYHHLFSMIGDIELSEQLEFTMSVKNGQCDFIGKEDWLYQFHKSIRQTDFFSGCTHTYSAPKITEEEKIELDAINSKFNSYTDSYPLEERRSLGGSRKMCKDKFPEDFERGVFLRSKERSTESKNINGHLDMILWNTIHMDSNGVLEKILKRTFNEYKFLLENE